VDKWQQVVRAIAFVATVVGLALAVQYGMFRTLSFYYAPSKERGHALGPPGGLILKRNLEEAFSRLAEANIAFNAPATMLFDVTVPIEFLLSLDESIETLQHEITAAGEREGFRIRAAAQMEVTLRAVRDSAFKVVPVTPETQHISVQESTRWLWDVTPVDWGPQELALTVSALYQVDGRDGKHALRTFHRKIRVEITTWQKGKVFLQNNWQWAWTALLVPLGGWALARARAGRRQTGQEDS
jgi:hypothetical protein